MNTNHKAGRTPDAAGRRTEPTARTSAPTARRTDPAARLLLTVEEAAEMLNIGRTLAYALVSAGELPSVTLGRLRRIPAASLRTWVEGLPVTPPPAD